MRGIRSQMNSLITGKAFYKCCNNYSTSTQLNPLPAEDEYIRSRTMRACVGWSALHKLKS